MQNESHVRFACITGMFSFYLGMNFQNGPRESDFVGHPRFSILFRSWVRFLRPQLSTFNSLFNIYGTYRVRLGVGAQDASSGKGGRCPVVDRSHP